jgi:Outer membrane protein beta-barrel domain
LSSSSHYIDDLFKNSIDPFEDIPAAKVWENINSQIAGDDAKKYKRKFIIASRIASVLFVLLLFLIIYEFVNIKEKKPFVAKRNVEYIINDKHFIDSVNSIDKKLITILKKGEMNINYKSNSQLPVRIKKGNQNKYSSTRESLNRKYQDTHGKMVYQQKRSGVLNLASNITEIKTDNGIQLLSDKQHTMTGVNFSDSLMNSLRIVNSSQSSALEEQKMTVRSAYKPSLSVSVFGSAVCAKYYLQDDVPENVFAQNTVQNSLRFSDQRVNRSIIEERENPDLSFNVAILIAYDFNKHLGFQTGLVYNSSYISIQPQKTYASKDADGNVGYELITSSGYGFVNPKFSNAPTVGDSLLTTVAHHKLQYLTLPLLLKYNIYKNKLSMSPGLGIGINFLTGTSIQTELENSQSSETVFISKLQGTQLIHLSLLANTEIKYDLNKKVALDLIPALSYAFTPLTKNSVVKTYPYNFSIGIGIHYKF